MENIKNRLEYLRQELREERISYGEIAELESLAEYIEDNDVELLEAAGVDEFSRNTKFTQSGERVELKNEYRNLGHGKQVKVVYSDNSIGWEYIKDLQNP